MNLSLESLREAVNLREQIDALEQRLASLFSGGLPASPAKSSGSSSSESSKFRGARTMSAAARAKIAAAPRLPREAGWHEEAWHLSEREEAPFRDDESAVGGKEERLQLEGGPLIARDAGRAGQLILSA
jgi:hypothetical protein